MIEYVYPFSFYHQFFVNYSFFVSVSYIIDILHIHQLVKLIIAFFADQNDALTVNRMQVSSCSIFFIFIYNIYLLFMIYAYVYKFLTLNSAGCKLEREAGNETSKISFLKRGKCSSVSHQN